MLIGRVDSHLIEVYVECLVLYDVTLCALNLSSFQIVAVVHFAEPTTCLDSSPRASVVCGGKNNYFFKCLTCDRWSFQ